MEIKRINTNQIQPGMIIAENVYNSINQLIVPRDAVLTDKAIARIRFHSISSIKIYVEGPISEVTKVLAPEQASYFDKLRDTEEFAQFNGDFNSALAVFESNFTLMLQNGTTPNRKVMKECIHSLLDPCRTSIQLFDLLHCKRNSDDVTFSHSVNVALICAVMGIWLNYNSADIDLLIECGIYHDIGKLLIPKNIVEKPTALSNDEFSLIKTHTMKGYNIIRNLDFDTRVKLGTMMHHERCDGSGYPLGIKSDQIDDFSKILAIADVYEAMTSPRVYRDRICPFEVISTFEREGLTLYDPKFLMVFMENITQCYLGNNVRLSDGTIGTIVYTNKFAYSRPMIQSGEEYIDLSKDLTRSIAAIL